MWETVVLSLRRTQESDSRMPLLVVMTYLPSGLRSMLIGIESTGAGAVRRSGVMSFPVAKGVCGFWHPARKSAATAAAETRFNFDLRKNVRTVGPFPYADAGASP